MYCSNCGNKLEKEDKFCRNCSKEIIYIQQDNKEKNNNYLNKLGANYLNLFKMLITFGGAIPLQWLIITYSMIKEMSELEQGGSAFGLMFVPVLSIIVLIPHFIGYLIEKLNKRKNNYILSIFVFIASCLSLVSIMQLKLDIENTAYIILIIHCCILIINYYLKLRRDIRKNN